MNKLALFCGSLSRGGAERVTVMLAEYFADRSYPVVIVTISRAASEYELPAGVDRIVLLEEEKNTGVIGDIHFASSVIKKFHKVLLENKIELVLAMGVTGCPFVVLGAIGTKAKVIVSERNAPGFFAGRKITKLISRFFLIFSDGYVFQTEDAKAYYGKLLRGGGVVIHNPLDVYSLPERYSGVREARIVSVGRLERQKNHMMLIHAFSMIVEEFPAYMLEIYGEGKEREMLQRQINELGLQGRIQLMGNVTDVYMKICRASMFVFTSDFEGMPNALIEAMALGLPCISTDCPCGGPRELINDGDNGLLVPVGDVTATAEAMRQILRNEERASALGEAAYGIREKLKLEKIGSQWEEYVQDIIARS